jgi:hypothetical protein
VGFEPAPRPGATYSYGYDGDGARVSRRHQDPSVQLDLTTVYLYDVSRSLPVLLEDGTRKYVWGVGLAMRRGLVGSTGPPFRPAGERAGAQ